MVFREEIGSDGQRYWVGAFIDGPNADVDIVLYDIENEIWYANTDTAVTSNDVKIKLFDVCFDRLGMSYMPNGDRSATERKDVEFEGDITSLQNTITDTEENANSHLQETDESSRSPTASNRG